jgi:hypothetical protein
MRTILELGENTLGTKKNPKNPKPQPWPKERKKERKKN